jgi:hypothetical protein
MKLTVLTAIVGLLLVGVILELVRRRQLREKYALLWLAVGIVVVPLAIFPRLLDRLAGVVGVVSGVSLVLFLGLVFLLLVCLHLSWEVNRLEEETRTLAEDIALLRTTLQATHPGTDEGGTR